ncbi:major facilitator superfamily transporter [Elsinoe ampelina]|uniref:Major facilitator superfamily transporter n=1 Tax=Elsinoe ampelina TaxID=302913 RepID=A0A6A6G4Z1_9PEZI|nr:major facilitator superfamily transporter [Elsinoe ampelina]
MQELGVEVNSAGLMVWRHDCSDHPRNWSSSRKVYDILVVGLLEFYGTVISTTGPSAAAASRDEYNLTALTSLVAFGLVYQLGQAIGGLVIPPLSESFGRRTPYIASAVVYTIFCLLIGLVPSVAMVYIGRFLTGLASAVPSVVLAGSVEDMFNSRQRKWLVLVWVSLATAGLICGPIYGVYISAHLGWRWIYHSSSIGMALLTLLLLFIRESRPSLILTTKIHLLSKEFSTPFPYDNHDSVPSRTALLNTILVRPARLLTTEPLVILITTLSATSWALIYLFTEALTGIYHLSLNFPPTTASLPFLAMGAGILLSIPPRFLDLRVAKRRKRTNLPLEPEDKLTGFTLAVVALAIGLWWLAWTIPPRVTGVHWAVPTAGLVLVGFAVNEIAYTLSGYLADSYTVYAASAFAGLAFVRAIVSGLMPLVAHALYGRLGANVATSVVAGLATSFGVAPWVLYRYSRGMRGRSSFAKYSLEVHERTKVEDD